MGTKDSKPLVVAYEEAIKRVPEPDLRRLRNAFKRFATGQGLLTKQVFIKEVLGDILPLPLAELIYTACGGQTKGIVLKDLLCGLVLLSLGTLEEKTRLLFNLYASDATQITKDELVNLVGTYEGPNAAHRIAHCFQDVDRVNLDIFRDTVLANPDLTCLVTWLLEPPAGVSLSTEQDSPTFYQTLSGVTHLDESEIIELEKRYWQLKSYSLSGKFDLETFELLVTPPLGDEALASVLVRNLFFALDENCDGHVDFKEMACGVSAACRGPLAERLKYRDGLLNSEETQVMLQTLVSLQSEANKNLNYLDGLKQELTEDAEDINLERFLVWGVASPLPIALLTLLFEICHVILGLNPRTRQEEEEVVLGWLKREEERGLQLGQFWYLVVWDWWASWKHYTTYLNVEDSPILNNNASSASLKSLIASPNLKTSPSSNSLTRSNKSSVSDGVVLTSLTLLNNEMEEIRLLPKLSNGTLSSSTGNEPKMPPSKPGAIDNSILIIPTVNKVMILTGEGGRLRKVPTVTQNKDYHLFPEPLWKALVAWYGGSPALPRQVIANPDTGQLELELYPFVLKLLRHQSANQSFQPQPAGWSGLVGGYGAAALGGGYGYSPSTSLPPRRYLAYTAAFSRLANIRQMYEYLCSRLRLKAEDMRLWHVRDDTMNLLEDEEPTLIGLGIDDQDQILIEIRNKDQTWPEEMVSLTVSGSDRTKTVVPTEKGATGLNNLGNTCFMNAALQCVSNTLPLTQYFLAHVHLKELNRTNPLGMKGNIAKDYGELVHDIWRGTIRTVAPLRLRWTIGKYAPRFSGYAQHDAQELLAFLLDGLHEDLNRVQDKPYVELRDSENRPDDVVAQEAWENHLLRNRSIIVDLFHGQLKSKVTCQVCSQESVRFDPFNYLSLPLPVETLVHMEVVVVKSDGSTPVKYGLRLPLDSTYADLQKKLEGLCGVSAYRLLLAEVSGAQIKSFASAESKLRATSGVPLFAYEALTTNSQEDQNLLMPNASLAQIQRVASTSPRVARTSKTANGNVPNGEISQSNINWTQICQQISSSSDSSNRVCLEGENRGIRAKQEEESTGIVKTLETPETILSPGRTGREREPSAGSGHSLPDSLTSITSSSQGSQSPDSEAESSLGLSVNVLMAYHRKMIRQDVYFLSCHKTRPSLFGLPLLIPYLGDVTTGQELYKSVWTLVARLVSPLPPQDNSAIPNHAQDCDDSLGYEFPFVLSWVTSEGLQCSICPWNAFCRGCTIPCTPTPILDQRQRYVAIDWDPTALHLRYQASLERVFIQHESVSETAKAQTEPISLARCLDAFTHEEQLAGDEKWYCSNCKAHQPATKKLQIWRLPPILIVHLKRFQFVNQRWVKSQKMVNFRLKDFDPTPFLASVPRETILRHRQIALGFDSQENSSWLDPNAASGESGKRNRVQSTSLANHPIVDEELRDFHQHKLQQGTNPFDITYRLYAAVCHSGMLGGGHYVAYAWNPNNKWYCYNDSSCKEVNPAMIEAQSAYMLFYEREGLDLANYLPQVSSNGTILHDNDHNISLTPSFALPTVNDVPSPQTADAGNSDEQDRKNCVLM